jgi:hypothetical protein
MNIYSPDCWIIVELSGSNIPKTHRRILAGWYGDFLQGDSWKLSGGIESVTERTEFWEVLTASGSIYLLYKNNEGVSRLTQAILESYKEDSSDEMGIKQVGITNQPQNEE